MIPNILQKKRFLGLAVLAFIMWRLYRLRNTKLEVRRSRTPNSVASRVFQLFEIKESFKNGYVDSFLMRWGGEYRGSVSTVLHYAARKIKPVSVIYERELIPLPDGGTIALDWAYQRPKTDEQPKPTIFLHHGLCGNSDSHYITHLIPLLDARGYRAVVMIARGCGGLKLTTPEGFTASRTSDMRHAVKLVRSQPFVSEMYGVGFSLGAVLMLKYLGEEGDKTPLQGAVAISPSFDFAKTPPHFELWSRLRLVKGLIEWAKNHEEVLSKHPQIRWDEVMNAENVRKFDAAAVVGPYGYKDVDHYYEDSSPRYKTGGITVPTLSISAEDDPVCCATSVPSHGHDEIGPGLVACVTNAGGHVSFPEGPWGTEAWTDRVVLDWIQSCREASGLQE